MANRGKLELTWVGKDERVKLEPRALVEDPSKSYGDPNNENMLIYGDNLLALKALEQDFTGKIKCIYIDPPFNTGARIAADGTEVGYDDGLEHSEWLNMMYIRLELLQSLLSPDGAIFIHIDDTEIAYLVAIGDEIFRRNNRLPIITVKRGSVTGPKVINPGIVNLADYIIIYAKERSLWRPNRVYRKKKRDTRYGKFILNRTSEPSKWQFITLSQVFANYKGVPLKMLRKIKKEDLEKEMETFVLNNAEAVARTAALDNSKISKEALELKTLSKQNPNKIFILERPDYENWYIINGERILFYSDRLSTIDGALVPGELISNIWDDVLPNDLHNEGQVTFKKGKKPEKLIKRVFELASSEGDWILDSFAGSGTAGAVAHKMKRKWILCELSVQCDTHAFPRLRRVIDGHDNSGITKHVNWRGGGGFKYYRLAESLLVRDKELSTKNHPVYIINPRYDEKMLIRAICKIENFRYRNEGRLHGISSENRFLHITTNLLTQVYLDSLAEDLSKDQSLLIYCTRRKNKLVISENIEIKKIPRDLLSKCDFEEEKK